MHVQETILRVGRMKFLRIICLFRFFLCIAGSALLRCAVFGGCGIERGNDQSVSQTVECVNSYRDAIRADRVDIFSRQSSNED